MSCLCHAYLPFPFVPEPEVHLALRVQLLLRELFKAQQAVLKKKTDQLFTPLFGHLNQIYYHGQGVLSSCSENRTRTQALLSILTRLSRLTEHTDNHCIHKLLQTLWLRLEPLLIRHKYNENLFLFLLQNRAQIDLLMDTPGYLHLFWMQLYPEGLELVGEKLCDQYHRRGFFAQVSECQLLLTQLLHARPST